MTITLWPAGILLVCATGLGAQGAASCSGPGAAFGITAFECASCRIKQGEGIRTQYVFQAEPVVLEATASSVFRPGDVVEAVNGQPIMSAAGGERFTYPPPGQTTVTVRRGNARVQLSTTVAGCREPRGRVRDVQPSNEPLIIVDGVPVTDVADADPTLALGPRRFGFAVACTPSCTRVRAADGSDYYKFDGYPPVVAVMPGEAAALAGLRVGDRVVEIDGKSILDEEGAVRFLRENRRDSLSVTVLRDGKRTSYTLRAK